MAAGNETNNFVREGSMLPHHDIDTTTTPNSWKPKAHTIDAHVKPYALTTQVNVPFNVATTVFSYTIPNSGVHTIDIGTRPVLITGSNIDDTTATSVCETFLFYGSVLQSVENMARQGSGNHSHHRTNYLTSGTVVSLAILQRINTAGLDFYAPSNYSINRITEA